MNGASNTDRARQPSEGLSALPPAGGRSLDILSYGEPLVGFYPAETPPAGASVEAKPATETLAEETRARAAGERSVNTTPAPDTLVKAPAGQPGCTNKSSNTEEAPVPLKTPWIATWGGDTSNVVLAASKLGLSCAYLTRVGEDPFGEGLLSLWRSAGVRADFVQKDPDRRTGLYFVTFREGKHILTYYRKDSAAAHIDPTQFDPQVLDSTRVLHLSGISLAISAAAREFGVFLMKEARKQGAWVSLDTNFRPALWKSPAEARELFEGVIAEHAQVFATTDEEMELLGWGREPGNLPRLLPGPFYYLVKRGGKGAFLKGPDGEVSLPAFPVRVVDTVGAGDAFDAAFLYGLLRGLEGVPMVPTAEKGPDVPTPEQALPRAAPPLGLAALGVFASAVAALVCAGQGPLETQPSLEEAEAFLKKQTSFHLSVGGP